MASKVGAIFSLFLVVEHGEVGGVARGSEPVGFESFDDGTTRFLGVGAVGEATTFSEGKDVAEVVGDFFRLHVERAKPLDTGDVDEAARRLIIGRRKVEEFAESGGVHPRAVGVGNFGRLHLRIGNELIEQRAFAHARMSGQKGDFPREPWTQCFQSVAGERRNLVHLVAHVGVDVREVVGRDAFVVGQIVHFVEHQHDGDAIGFGRSQEAVDESGAGLGARQGGHQEGLVDVGGEDVALFGEVGSFADDVVAAWVDGGDESEFALAVVAQRHAISHRHGVGGADAFEAEIAFDAAFDELPFIGAHKITASGVFDDDAVHEVEGLGGDFRK